MFFLGPRIQILSPIYLQVSHFYFQIDLNKKKYITIEPEHEGRQKLTCQWAIFLEKETVSIRKIFLVFSRMTYINP